MKVTRERKILAGVMVAGLLALIVDRATGSGGADPSPPPTEAADSPVVTPAVAAATHKATPTLAATRPTSTRSLSARIATLARAELPAGPAARARDPFRVPTSWADNQNTAAKAAPSPAARFESVHRLTAVVLDGRQSRAVIDGALLRLGQSVDGHTLVAVTQDMAVLECGKSRVLLKLDRGASVATADAH